MDKVAMINMVAMMTKEVIDEGYYDEGGYDEGYDQQGHEGYEHGYGEEEYY